MTFKNTWCGALVAAIVLELFIILFPLYVRQFMSNYAGQIGFAIILIFFFYYFALILIIGAQINAQFFEQHRPLPKPLGTFISQMYEEQSQRNTTDSSHNKTSEQQHHSKREWIHRLCCCRKRQSVQVQSPEDSNV